MDWDKLKYLEQCPVHGTHYVVSVVLITIRIPNTLCAM